jgi:transcriptional regulator with XRE-family HTH domain
MQEEIWKAVVGYEGFYEVSTLGNIRSLDRIGENGRRWKGRVMKPQVVRGYLHVALNRNGHTKQCLLHRLIVEAFIGSIPEGYQVNHRDCNKVNNRVSNLEIVTASQNMRHAHDNGLVRPSSARGEAISISVLTEADVIRIFEMSASGMSQKEIADMLGVAKNTIQCVLSRFTWSHVDVDPELVERARAIDRQPRGSRVGGARLAEGDILRIFEMRAGGMSQKEIADVFGVSRATIGHVLYRECWPHVPVDPELVRRALETDNQVRGKRVAGARLAEDDVYAIREALKTGKTQTELAKAYGVGVNAINSIYHGKTWNWLK